MGRFKDSFVDQSKSCITDINTILYNIDGCIVDWDRSTEVLIKSSLYEALGKMQFVLDMIEDSDFKEDEPAYAEEGDVCDV